MATPGTLPSVSWPLGSKARLSAFLGAPTSPVEVGENSAPPPAPCPSTARPVGPKDLASHGGLGCRDQGVRETSELSGLPVGEARLAERLFILPCHSLMSLSWWTDRFQGEGFLLVGVVSESWATSKPPPSS